MELPLGAGLPKRPAGGKFFLMARKERQPRGSRPPRKKRKRKGYAPKQKQQKKTKVDPKAERDKHRECSIPSASGRGSISRFTHLGDYYDEDKAKNAGGCVYVERF